MQVNEQGELVLPQELSQQLGLRPGEELPMEQLMAVLPEVRKLQGSSSSPSVPKAMSTFARLGRS